MTTRLRTSLLLTLAILTTIAYIGQRAPRIILAPTPVGVLDFRLLFDHPMSQEFHHGTNGRRVHKAIDIATPTGVPIVTTVPGKVVKINPCIACKDAVPSCSTSDYRNKDFGYGWGKFVWVRHDFDDLPQAVRAKYQRTKYFYALYAHLDDILVSENEHIVRGQIVGFTGNTGCSTGDHIHIEVRLGDLEDPSGHWQEQRAINPQELL